ncbi:hypothetical protein CDD83_5123 [Cordyceps sp. RAO-2017]|nr:hypothetical protein CDD83_5123 [Cordyceps sp. RAO-2017]
MSAGLLVSIIISLAIWYSNSWNTGYLPINTNQVFDHFGQPYNISNVLDERGSFDERKYASYSAPYIGSMFTVLYGAYFSMYAGFATYAVLHIRREIKLGLRNLLRCFTFPWRKLRKARGKGGAGKPRPEEQQHTDVHNRLMAAYPEVSEWWYLGVLVVSLIFGVLGLTLYPTFTSPLVVFYGIALALIVIIPNGIIASSTGIEIPQDILAGILGSIIARGNPLSILYFRSYGFITLAHATAFAKDLKLAHYVKIPPRVTFVGQMVSTFISTLICACVMMYQVGIPDVCTPNAPNRYFCPGVKVGATDIILSGTVGSLRIFGVQYPWLLMGFLYGAVVVVGLWGLKRWWPGSRALRQVHSMVFLVGSIQLIPYNFAYSLPTVPVAWFSWIYIRGRYPGFWSKYNFVLSSALSAGIAISALAMAFTVQWADVKLDWWGNTQQAQGCEKDPCLLRTLGPGERFFPWWDGSKSPAP